jgi:hypothetical protein
MPKITEMTLGGEIFSEYFSIAQLTMSPAVRPPLKSSGNPLGPTGKYLIVG